MPIPTPKENETQKEFLQRCMSDPVMVAEYKTTDQRYIVCINKFREK